MPGFLSEPRLKTISQARASLETGSSWVRGFSCDRIQESRAGLLGVGWGVVGWGGDHYVVVPGKRLMISSCVQSTVTRGEDSRERVGDTCTTNLPSCRDMRVPGQSLRQDNQTRERD